MLCMREKIFNKYNASSSKSPLVLLACSFCDSCKEKGTIVFDNKLQSLFVFPIYTIIRSVEENDSLMRIISIGVLEKVQDMFGGKAAAREDEISQFVKTYNEYVDNKSEQSKLIELYQSIGESSYLEFFKRILSERQYGIALDIAMNFFSLNVEVGGHGFHYYYDYKRNRKQEDNKDIFFEIGRMLDEGATEWLTQELSQRDELGEPEEPRYHTEVSYIKKLFEKYSQDKVIKAYMSHLLDGNPVDFFYDITESSDKCDYYRMFKFTDGQDWRSAISLLNRLPKINDLEGK